MSLIKPVRGIALAAFFLFLAAASVLVYLRRSGMPARMGAHPVTGLDATVTVRWDEWGVPHVNADSQEDLARAMGWLHANDRMTQMELGRRAASGTLSEIVGEPAIEQDIYFHTLGFPEAAEKLWQSASEDSKKMLEAYAEGVNAWLLERKGRVTPGLKILGADPGPWTPQDSLRFALLMAQDLSFWNQRPEEERFQWLRAFGPEGVRDLLGDPDLHVPEAILELAGQKVEHAAAPSAPVAPSAPGDLTGLTGLTDKEQSDSANTEPNPEPTLLDGDPPSPGSNNWLIGGSRTESGKPLLANDPHLGLFLPSVWYQVQLRSPTYEAAGMTLPGTPGVVIGRGPAIAWAFTNTMLDDHDIFFEQVNDQGQVLRGESWQDVVEEKRSLLLRDGSRHAFTIRRTDIGPLLDADPKRGLPARSVAWTAHYPGDPIAALVNLARAETPEQAQAAIEGYVCPAQNLVAGFPNGDLLYTVLGRVPDRKRGDGRLPAPAWDPTYGWNGLRPRPTNPTMVNPEDDLIVTANHDIRPKGYALPLTAEFFAPFRADRIRESLLAKEKWDRQSFADLQLDAHSLFAVDLVEILKAEAPFEGDAQSAFETLSAWDGTMAPKGPAGLFALLSRELSAQIFADESTAAELEHSVSHRDRVHRVLRGDMSQSWLDNVKTEAVEDRHAILQSSLEKAWQTAEQHWSGRTSQWDYGWLHSLRLNHRLDAVPFYGGWTRRGPYPVAGSSTTILAFGSRWREDGRQHITYGPSMRWIVDWSEPDRAWAVLPGGQSGHPSDRHYDDQIRPYLDGELHVAPWSEEAIAEATKREMTLEPYP